MDKALENRVKLYASGDFETVQEGVLNKLVDESVVAFAIGEFIQGKYGAWTRIMEYLNHKVSTKDYVPVADAAVVPEDDNVPAFGELAQTATTTEVATQPEEKQAEEVAATEEAVAEAQAPETASEEQQEAPVEAPVEETQEEVPAKKSRK